MTTVWQRIARLFDTPDYLLPYDEVRALRRAERWELAAPELLWAISGVRR